MANSVIQLPRGSQAAVAPTAATPPTLLTEPVQPQAPNITVATTAAPAVQWQPPILGSLAAIFGVASLFTGTLVLAPLAFVLALTAGIFRQVSWAVIGGAAAAVALATSKYFWALLGLAWLINRMSWLWN